MKALLEAGGRELVMLTRTMEIAASTFFAAGMPAAQGLITISGSGCSAGRCEHHYTHTAHLIIHVIALVCVRVVCMCVREYNAQPFAWPIVTRVDYSQTHTAY